MRDLFEAVMRRAVKYMDSLDSRPVAPTAQMLADLTKLDLPLQDDPIDPIDVLEQLDDYGSPATVATTGGRFFGFVTGGSLPAATAANMLASVWDQNSVNEAQSPVTATVEEICRKWLIDLLKLPVESAASFVTGATMANFTALAAARHATLAHNGWNVEEQGLFGAPPIEVIVGDEVHVSVLKAISMLGLGRERVMRVPVDDQGRIRSDSIPEMNDNTIICLQAGNVNTGAIDPLTKICRMAGESGAWVHVDGAFGMWAAVTPDYASLLEGIELADSWATDAHKWLNVPYDNGVAFVRQPAHLLAAMSKQAAYLSTGINAGTIREPSQFTPELSRRSRAVDIWAALRSLGRNGIAEIIERNCRQARRLAEGLGAAGYSILNDVVLNQVLVSFGTAEQTREVIARIQADGTCWCGGTEWQGHVAMRISVASWATTDDDIEKSLAAMLNAAAQVKVAG
jgi:glutamate/tyrosine decarboxylase-like PLP-dependent enzyme